jgi:hypothetical protein
VIDSGECIRGRCVAIMQPYFYPYLPYFALLAAADTFVIYDCVQFPRRGRVHRSEIAEADGLSTWLTLPVQRQPQCTLIRDLAFAQGATEEFRRRIKACAPLAAVFNRLPADVRGHLQRELTDVVDFLEQGLRAVADHLGIESSIIRSSSLKIDPKLRSADRIIAISKAVGASVYVNAPGGRLLYNRAQFEAADLRLEFLPAYAGPSRFLLPSLARTKANELRDEVLSVAAARQKD